MWTEQTDRWLREVRPFNSHIMKVRRKKACLMVIDMQNEFVAEEGAVFFHYAAEIIPNVKRLLAACRRTSIPVIFTGHVHEDPAVDGGMTAEWWPEIKRGESLVKGTKGVEIHPELKPRKREKIIWKHRYSAFYNTPLEDRLKELKPEKIIVCGVLTNICVLHTTADARNRDYDVEVPVDCVASPDESAHRFALEHMDKVLGAKLV